jgi:predicted Zn-dependent protease
VRAEQYLSASIDRGYSQDRALPSLIEVCVAASRLRAAIDYAEPYLRRNPKKWHLRYLVASLYLGVGEPSRARDELERVASEQPDKADPHYLLAVVLAEQFADYDRARTHYRRYLELAPESDKADEVRASLKLLDRAAGTDAARLDAREGEPRTEEAQQ